MDDTQTITATEFKAKCLDLLDRLGKRQIERIIVTKRGKPVAVLSPPEPDAAAIRALHGFMRGSVVIPAEADLTAPTMDEALHAEAGKLHS